MTAPDLNKPQKEFKKYSTRALYQEYKKSTMTAKNNKLIAELLRRVVLLEKTVEALQERVQP